MSLSLGSVRGRARLAALAVTGVVTLVAGSGVAAATPSASESVDGCIQLDVSGTQTWVGEPSSEADAMGAELSSLADEYPADVAGAAACSDYRGVVLFAKTVTDPIAEAVDSLAQAHPGYRVYTTLVPHSASDLEAAGNVLRSTASLMGRLSGFGPDLLSGGFYIDLPPGASSEDFAAVRDQVAQLIGPAFPVTFGEQAAATPAATRQSGPAAYVMGGGLYWRAGRLWNSSVTF